MQGTTHLIALTDLVAAKGGTNPLMSLVPFILIAVVFYFLLIRPQRRRQQQQSQLQNRLVPGQRVMTTAGLFATVVAIEDDAVVLEIAPGVEARFVKQAIGQVLDDSSAEEDTEADEEEEELHEAEETDQAEARTSAGDAKDALPADTIEPKTAEERASADEASKDGERRAGDKPAT